jgi:hypothetical protein
MTIVTLADLYAATTATPTRIQSGREARSVTYFWKLPTGSVIPGNDMPGVGEDDFDAAVKIYVTHDAQRKCFRAAIRTTSISESGQFSVERFSLFGPFVGEEIITEPTARFNAKRFAAFAAVAIDTAVVRGTQVSA